MTTPLGAGLGVQESDPGRRIPEPGTRLGTWIPGRGMEGCSSLWIPACDSCIRFLDAFHAGRETAVGEEAGCEGWFGGHVSCPFPMEKVPMEKAAWWAAFAR